MAPPSPPVFTVGRCEPELIPPAKPTPYEFKPLSDIDDQEGLRMQIPFIHFYRSNVSMEGKDPVKIIREAISKALVFYYPFAGRLREGPERKLIVECTGEGVMFIKANANITLGQFGEALQPPFPGMEDFFYDVPGSGGILNCPLLLIQVTRLMCGGFIFALRFNHTMSDGTGLVQFMTAVAEMAHGASAPSVQPVWARELLNARDPPRVSCVHHEYKRVLDSNSPGKPLDDIAQCCFFFGPREIKALRRHEVPRLSKSSIVELLNACIWRCRTIALEIDPDEEVYLGIFANARGKFNPPLPTGFYGNAVIFPMAVSTARELCQNPMNYTLELVKKVKPKVTEEYVRSVADLMVLKGRPHFNVVRSLLVSDLTRMGFSDVDFGWGKAVYGGPAIGVLGQLISAYIPFRNSKGEDGILVPIRLPRPTVKRFIAELESLTKDPVVDPQNGTSRLKGSSL